ncbi:hypothetical protein MJT46_010567 [Ovis ammon polii x Ovis aries]|nr:hypothetical protein MJT46_010567 [Ovis ammon polii x Ovis aries]
MRKMVEMPAVVSFLNELNLDGVRRTVSNIGDGDNAGTRSDCNNGEDKEHVNKTLMSRAFMRVLMIGKSVLRMWSPYVTALLSILSSVYGMCGSSQGCAVPASRSSLCPPAGRIRLPDTKEIDSVFRRGTVLNLGRDISVQSSSSGQIETLEKDLTSRVGNLEFGLNSTS